MTFCFLLLQLLLPFILPQSDLNPCGCEDKPQIKTLAAVNGVKITKQELGSDVQNRITLLQSQVISAREAELDILINSYLMEAEAKRRGQTTQQFLQTDVIDKVGEPTDAEVELYYKERKVRMAEDFKKAKPQIIALLKSEHQQLEALKLASSLRAAANVHVLVPNVSPPANEQDLNRVLATAAGRQFTSRDVEAALAPLIFEVQQQVYQLRKDDLDMRINDMLLEQEAKRQNSTPQIVLAKAVRARLPIITDQQAKAFYAENKGKIPGDFEKVKFQIIELLMQQEQDKISKAFAGELRQNAAVQIYLTPPERRTFPKRSQ
jgi:hypothetical protein